MNVTSNDAMYQAGLEFIHGLPAKVRRRGEDYFRKRAVRSVSCLSPDEGFVAKVAGVGRTYHVEMFYDASLAESSTGWDAECSCAELYDCQHVYAAMKSLLNTLTRGASPANLAPAPAPATKARPARPVAEKPVKISMTARLVAALGRPLEAGESRYVRLIEEGFRECRSRKAFMGWNASSLGFRSPGQSWDRLEIWPSLPKDVFEFWNHVAYAAKHQWAGTFPDFLDSITDFKSTDESVRQWRRREAIDRWSLRIDRLVTEVQSVGEGDVDLRLRLLDDQAVVEVRHEHQDEFKPLKTNPSRQLAQRVADGEVSLTPEAGVLWAILSPRVTYGGDLSIAYGDPRGIPLLHRLLRTNVLRGRIVTASGQPYEFAPEPLRWYLRAAATIDDDYGLRLVRNDHTPLPDLLLAISGPSVTCITAETVFFGPAVPATMDLTNGEVLIPAAAMERASGIALLRTLNLELPARVRERVQIIPFRVTITCELAPTYPGSATEQCRVHLTAESDDGLLEERWDGSTSTWEQARASKLRTHVAGSEPGSEPIVSYDRSTLAGAPQWLAPLNLRWNSWHNFGEIRVTKKFPEEFMAWRQSLPTEIRLELEGDLASLARDDVAGSVKLNVAEAGIDWFDLSVILHVAETDLSSAEIKLLLNARGGYVRLNEKGWRRLRFDLSADEDERLARLGLNPRELTSEPQRLHVLQLADPAARRFLPEEQFERVHRRAAELQARVTPDLPAGVRAELRPYQRDGFHFLCYLSTNRFGGILADDMGLGKTLQTLTWLQWLRDQPDKPKAAAVLVVCPKSVTDNWRRETERFAPDLKTRVWTAGELERMPEETRSADLHIMNYSQLRVVGESLAKVNWQAVILDEGQYIKNPDSQTAQVARSLRAEHRLILSGTPIENRLMDLWSLMTFAMPGVLGSRTQFTRMFGGKDDPLARRRLAARVRPFLLRRTKSQVAKDLPDRIEEDLLCEMEGEQKALYRAELKVAQQILLKVETSQQLAKERFNFLTSLLRLRQICCDPRLVKADSKGASAKVEALLEQLEPLMDEGQKVLVFSQFVTMLDLLRVTLKERGWPQFYLAGDTENRGDLVEKFQSAQGPAVFLISLKAGGFGLNLTAAGYVVLFDPWWNPAVENQAIDRTHRIGQTQNVIAYRLLMKDSVEEKIRALQKQKHSLVQDVLGEEKFSQSLTIDDLRYLLTD